jgi:hypothetical protein
MELDTLKAPTRDVVCNAWFDYPTSHGAPDFQGTCLVHVDGRKNDTERTGHYFAFGRSEDPALDTVTSLRTRLRHPDEQAHPMR